jgi:hypothetical protein
MSAETGMGAETATNTPASRPLWRRILRRGPWENLATVLIAVGVVMLMQPISIDLYSYSLVTMLTGTVMFIIVTKFPD